MTDLTRAIELQQEGHIDEAEQSYRTILTTNPESTTALHNLGVICATSGRTEEACSLFSEAVRLYPVYQSAWRNLAMASRALRRWQDAERAYRKLLQLVPEDADALARLGGVLRQQGRTSQAVVCLEKAIKLDSGLLPAFHSLASVYHDQGQYKKSLQSFERCLALAPGNPAVVSSVATAMNYVPGISRGQILSSLRSMTAGWPESEQRIAARSADPGRRLKIGYISFDASWHPIGRFLQAPLRHHNHDHFDICFYHTGAATDEITDDLRSRCSTWHQLEGTPVRSIANRVREDDIDILVDLSGHTAGNRLPVFALRSAPVQISWLGYFGTTGLTEMDYLIADNTVIGLDEEGDYVEQVLRLPDSYLCFTEPSVNASPGPLPLTRNGYVTFGCFNNRAKISDETIALWSRVLKTVPESHLFLKYRQYADEKIVDDLIAQFVRHGIDSSRLRFEGKSDYVDFLGCYSQVDIALDPTPFAGGTTTAEALWMGVPTITLAGDSWAGRISASVLRASGAGDLVAESTEAYVATARRLSQDAGILAQRRRSLRTQMLDSAFCDGEAYTRALESL